MGRRILIGTSGYAYRHWAGGVFYPPDVPQGRWLEYYSRHFTTVELNVTFYRLPAEEVFRGWRERTPRGFTFAIKGSRFITHIKRMKECGEPLSRFLENASGLGEKLGVVLWQLHPGMKADPGMLARFCSLLERTATGRRVRHAFEFRNESWFTERIYEILGAGNHALCIAHSTRWPRAEVVTADFVYLRFHGGERLYGSLYSDEELKEWSLKALKWLRGRRALYAYFNNDARGYAVANARRLRGLIES